MFGLFGGGTPRITPDEAVAGVADGSVQLIDIREAGEVQATGKAKGAKHIPMMQLVQQCDPRSGGGADALDPAKTVALYCATGARSNQAGQILSKMGFKDVRNLGGLHDWVRGGGATERA
ncbi:rhodanese-like domain-containing protein [Rhodalgimonas zhirmunskyi]|uniref:Rhodanese-like domain-containing protein n=1 Tax=Rhodalgimonas zhirmunskyi TaxID=2964767 RepID=A0AAJ1X5H1_9RHOB|nr:rhodanese-like domain-containing protein [Rhodoalgimonas zhirmunskyi]MDQ2095243.1 rhodanese-like domain-containing protein [Rhodoalgimonas zhirmunskyi]